jgi:hypothetical protein
LSDGRREGPHYRGGSGLQVHSETDGHRGGASAGLENRGAAAHPASQFPCREELPQAVRQQPLFNFQFRFEPALGRAINLAVGEGYVDWVGGDRLQITAKGKRWMSEILKDESVMQEERDFLTRIGKDITETIATEMITVRSI